MPLPGVWNCPDFRGAEDVAPLGRVFAAKMGLLPPSEQAGPFRVFGRRFLARQPFPPKMDQSPAAVSARRLLPADNLDRHPHPIDDGVLDHQTRRLDGVTYEDRAAVHQIRKVAMCPLERPLQQPPRAFLR